MAIRQRPVGLEIARMVAGAMTLLSTTRHIDSPPSTGSTTPVMYPASSEARKPTAAHISDGEPNLPIGAIASICRRRSSGMLSTMRVAAFGLIALTVIPKRANSLATVLVNPMIPALAVEELAWPRLP